MGRLAHKRGVPAPQIVKIEEKYGMRYYTFMARLIAEPPLPAQVLFKEEEEVTKEKVSVEVSTYFVGVLYWRQCRIYFLIFNRGASILSSLLNLKLFVILLHFQLFISQMSKLMP